MRVALRCLMNSYNDDLHTSQAGRVLKRELRGTLFGYHSGSYSVLVAGLAKALVALWPSNMEPSQGPFYRRLKEPLFWFQVKFLERIHPLQSWARKEEGPARSRCLVKSYPF